MTQNQDIPAYSSASDGRIVSCTVPDTYQEKMAQQTTHPSCGFYAASYVLHCFNPKIRWTNTSLFESAQHYPLSNRSEGNLSEVGEVFHPEDFARFINEQAQGSCHAICQLFHESTIWDTIDQGGYVLVPFQVIHENGNDRHGFPKTNVQSADAPHAHWCVLAGYETTNRSQLLAKHWGKNHLFDMGDLRNSNQGNYPVQLTNGITSERAARVYLLQNRIITILPGEGADLSPSDRKGCAC